MKKIYLLALALIMLAFAGMELLAVQTLEPPIQFSGQYFVNKTSPPTYGIGLGWTRNPYGIQPTYYFVYMFEGKSTTISDFTKIAKVADTDGRNGVFTYSVNNLKPGIYSFYVTSVLVSDSSNTYLQSNPSQIIHIEIKSVDPPSDLFVRIVNTPPPSGNVGMEYMYKCMAESNANVPLLYEFVLKSPDGTKIVSTDGPVFRFTPTKAGTYYLYVTVYLSSDKNVKATQTFIITIGDKPQIKYCAVITGKVTDEDGKPIQKGIVAAYTGTNNRDGMEIYFEGVIYNGTYSFKVPEGKYWVRCDAAEFFTQWFDGANDPKNAEQVDVRCTDSIYHIVCNFNLKRMPPPVFHKVCGRVMNEDGSAPVMATVQFMPDPRLMKPINTNFSIVTDKEGYYCIELPDNSIYIGLAIPKSSQFQQQYFDRTENQLEADLIVVDKDLKGINFYLKAAHNQQKNGFGGTVTNEKGEPIMAQLIAYLINSRDKNFKNYKFSLTTKTNDKGNYNFSNLPFGDYVVLSVPIERNYLPGYCKLGSVVTQKWREATKIGVGTAMVQVRYDCKHRTINKWKGMANIKGFVGSKGTALKSDNSPLGSVPVSGAFVYIENDGIIPDYIFTDDNGNFEIREIAAGVYNIYADKPGYDLFTQEIATENSSNNDVVVDIMLNQTVTEVIEPVIIDNEVISVYPQPASQELNFISSDNNYITKVTLVNLVGNELLSFNPGDGTLTGSLDISSISQGVYFLKFECSSQIIIKPITVMK